MKEVCLDDLGYPLFFFKMFEKSVRIYFHSLLNYIIISFLVYSPLLLFEITGQPQLVTFFEMFHSSFVDILVFLTLPTLLVYNTVMPLRTIQIFLQRFFASAVVITIIQLFVYSFGSFFFGIIGLIPYVFIIFAGFFLVIENSSATFNVKRSLSQSLLLSRTVLLPIIWNLVLVSVLLSLPIVVFVFWHLSGNQELWEAYQASEAVLLANQEHSWEWMAKTAESTRSVFLQLFKEPEFRVGWAFLHILIRPLKAIFIAVMFIALMQRLDPVRIKKYLSIHSQESSSDSTTENL